MKIKYEKDTPVLTELRSREELEKFHLEHPGGKVSLESKHLPGVAWRALNLQGASFVNTRFAEGMVGTSSVGYKWWEDPETPPERLPVILEHIGAGHTGSACNLSHCNFTKAHFSNCTFSRASLSGSSLSGTTLQQCIFVSSRLDFADFSGARLAYNSFFGCDLSKTEGLDDLGKQARRTNSRNLALLDVKTLVLSRAIVPRDFLWACGFDDTWIEYIPDLVSSMSPIGLQSCMLSHSTRDAYFCDRLFNSLIDKSIPVWYAPKDMMPGNISRHQMAQAVNVCDRMLLVLSEHSMNSNWVRNEIKWAVKKQIANGKDVLFPVSLVPFERLRSWELWDDDHGIDLAEQIRKYHIHDFTPAIKDPSLFASSVELVVRALSSNRHFVLPSHKPR